MEKYNHKKIEKFWQEYWEEHKTHEAINNDKKPKFYGLIEFPYPSGEGLHVGHIRSNTAMDIICRKRRMEGYNVLYPIGWDAFGLPTENYAIKTGIHPITVTKKNTDTFRHQLKEVGFSFDWSREINTTDPEYYKWTQWIFLQFFKKGLAYKKKMDINWCPKDKIGLANEEVIDGKCERCGTPVEKKEKEQWMLAITKYADRLDRDLDEAVFPGNSRTLPKKLLVGTRNLAKVKMFKDALRGVKNLEIVSLIDLPEIDDSSLKEGDDFRKNARKKSEFYFKKTGLPTISTDQIQWVEKWPKDGGFILHARKLANPKSPRATDDEVGAWIEKLVDKYGESKATFHYAISYTDQYGTNDFVSIQRDYLLQKEKSPKTNDGYVFDRYMKDLETKEFRIEQPTSVAFSKFEEFIRGEFLNLFTEDGKKAVDYLEKIKIQQKNWIGRSEGAEVEFRIKNLELRIKIYTTRIDTIFGCTYVVLAPEHVLVNKLKPQITNWPEVEKYIKEAKKKSEIDRTAEEKEKTGVKLAGVMAVNPFNKEEIPVFIADYVLVDYGTGAVMAVPAHDIRDFDFAKKYSLGIKAVVMPEDQGIINAITKRFEPIPSKDDPRYNFVIKVISEGIIMAASVGNGVLINSNKYDGLVSGEAREKMTAWLEKNGQGRKQVNYKLRDWIFSRQHYWGEPIPVVFCENCAKKKYNVILLHGYGGKGNSNYRPWLKRELEIRGHKVFTPDLPNTEGPNVNEQADYVIKNFKLDKDTILLGGSLGGSVVMRILEKIKGQIAKAILVDPVVFPEFNDHHRPDVKAAHDWKFDYKKIRKSAGEIILLGDENFPIITREQLVSAEKALDAPLVLVRTSGPHFKAEIEPEILKLFENPGLVAVPADQLPVELPKVEKYQPTDTGESPLAAMTDWVNTKCPKCGGPAKRETDTMPNWAGSSWYYLRYTDSKDKKVFAGTDKLRYWLPVDWYNGGMEHTTLHLLYSRFWHKFLFDLGLVPTSEPYQKRTSHGLILAEGGVKMSKSKGNVINPDEIVKDFGADSLRVYEMFMGPFDQAIAWSTDGLAGARRFLDKIWNLYNTVEFFECGGKKPCPDAPAGLPQMLHKTIKKVSEDIEAMKFNTAISQMMIFINFAGNLSRLPRGAAEKFLIILAPFAPHLTEELWAELGNKESIFKEKWPMYDKNLIKDETIKLVLQVNGKVRDIVEAAADIKEEEAKKIALENEKIKKWLNGKEVKKVIFVKGKLVNIVV